MCKDCECKSEGQESEKENNPYFIERTVKEGNHILSTEQALEIKKAVIDFFERCSAPAPKFPSGQYPEAEKRGIHFDPLAAFVNPESVMCNMGEEHLKALAERLQKTVFTLQKPIDKCETCKQWDESAPSERKPCLLSRTNHKDMASGCGLLTSRDFGCTLHEPR